MKKTIRIFFKQPLNTDWKTVWQNLPDLQCQTAKALNYCMNEWFTWQYGREAWKKEKGKYPTFKELPEPVKRLYAELRSQFPDIQSKSISEIVRKSKARWKTDCKEVFYSHAKSLSTFKKTHPILVNGQQYTIEKKDEEYFFHVGLRPKDYDGIRRFSFSLLIHKFTASQKAILERLISGEYKKSAAQIALHNKKKKWYVNLVYDFENKEMELNPNKAVGVDLGIKKAFFCGIHGEKKRLYADGTEIVEYRKKIRFRRKSYQNQSKFSNRKGKGRKKILKPVLDIGSKEFRFRDTRYHQFSRQIVDFAVQNGCGVIQLEKLDGLVEAGKTGHFLLKDWAISALHQKIEYKAEEYGIKVVYVHPQYTSQRCSHCGYIDRQNREIQEQFICKSCGYEENADYNAALNISIIGIEDIIKKEIARCAGSEKKQEQLALL